MTDLPTVIATATLPIMGVDLVVHNLSDGQRFIDVESMNRFFEAMANGGDFTPDEAMKLAKVLRSPSLTTGGE